MNELSKWVAGCACPLGTIFFLLYLHFSARRDACYAESRSLRQKLVDMEDEDDWHLPPKKKLDRKIREQVAHLGESAAWYHTAQHKMSAIAGICASLLSLAIGYQILRVFFPD